MATNKTYQTVEDRAEAAEREVKAMQPVVKAAAMTRKAHVAIIQHIGRCPAGLSCKPGQCIERDKLEGIYQQAKVAMFDAAEPPGEEDDAS
jgi:hypothetical protein